MAASFGVRIEGALPEITVFTVDGQCAQFVMLVRSGGISVSFKEEIPSLSLGAIVGGVSHRPTAWGDAIDRLGSRIAGLCGGIESSIRVSVVFQISGEAFSADFSGVRTGYCSKADRLLLVQAAVPDEDYLSDLVLLDLLDDAIAAIVRYVRKKRLAEDLPELLAIAKKLR